jgi:WD40 repeat protein
MLFKYHVVLFICCISFGFFAQELKLGLPLGHSGWVLSIAFSSNNKLLVTASSDNTAKVWEAETSKLIYTLIGHKESVISASFSSDDKNIITCSYDGTAKIWETSSGKLVHSFGDRNYKINYASFSPDGTKVLTSAFANTPRIWNTQTGQIMHQISNYENLSLVRFSPDGLSIIGIRNGDFRINCWKVNNGEKINFLSGHKDEILSMEFSPDGKKLISTSNDSTAILWDLINFKKIIQLKKHPDHVLKAVFNNDGKMVATTCADSIVRIWETDTGLLAHYLEEHLKPIKSIFFSPDGNSILITTDTRTKLKNGTYRVEVKNEKAQLWDVGSGKLSREFDGHFGQINLAVFDYDGKNVYTCADDHSVKIWDATNGLLKSSLVGKNSDIQTMKYSPNGESLMGIFGYSWITKGTSSNEAIILDMVSGKPFFNFEMNDKSMVADFSQSGKEIVSSSPDNFSIHIWDMNSKNTIQKINLHRYIYSIEFSPDGKQIVTTSYQSNPKVWDSKSGNLIFELNNGNRIAQNAKYSPDGKVIVTISNDSTFQVWSNITREIIVDVKEESKDVIFSSDGQKMINIATNTYPGVWDVATGRLLFMLFSDEFEKKAKSAMFSPNGSTILTFSDDKTPKIWDSSNGQLLFKLEGHNSKIANAYFSPDGKIISNSNHQNVIVWDPENGKIISKLSNLPNDIETIVSPDALNVIISSKDLPTSIWDNNLNHEFIRFLIFDNDPNKWVHLHPSGLFDASPEAMELMYWTKGLEIIEFSQLKDRYWLPGLWEKVMKGETLTETRGMNELKLQPSAIWGEVKDGKIPITLTKREGGYGKVSILINGKEIEADARGEQFDKTKETQTVWVDLKDHPNLQNGENTIAVKASSEDGFVVGRPVEKKVTMSFQTAKPHFYAMVIGTGKYMNNSINLKYPEKDAESMSKALQLGSEKLFGKENTHIYTLTTSSAERPTKEKIKSVFTEIGKTAKSSDVILVYLSGHGITWGGDQSDFYYVTTDATASNSEAYNDELLRKNHLISTAEFTEYLKVIPANKQVMIIDACSSGKAVENLMAARDIDVSQIKAIDRMKDRTGMFVISGSAADAVSYEASRYGQGLLTYSILEAMKGAALRDGQFFDVNTILNYSRENVPRLAAGIGGIQTPQLLIPKGGSFDIGQVDEEAKKLIPLSNIKPVFVRTTFVDAEDFTDVLSLSKSIDDQLNEIAIRGKESQIVFLDTREFPDAYRLSGGYTQSNGTITLKLKIKGPKESEHQLTGNSKEIILEKIIEIVEGIE